MKKLDLHGVRHEDVKKELINFVEGCWNSGEDVEIITGHSSQMKELVVEVLEEYKLVYYVGGYLGVKPAIITTVI